MQERLHIRQSFLKMWMGCPLQAKFAHIDKLPRKQSAAATFGTCIHYALDLYNKDPDLDATISAFVDVWDNPEKLDATPETWPKYTSYGSYRERGLRMLRDYHERVRWEDREVIATEHQFEVPFGEFLLTGTVDLVERRKSSRGRDVLRIVDYKTNRKQPNFTTLNLDIQFTAYVYAAQREEFWCGTEDIPGVPNGEFYWEMLKDLPRRAIWCQIENNKEVDAGPRSEADFRRLYRACTEIAKAIEREVYVPNISGDTCLYCPYTDPCGVRIPSQQEIEEDEDRWL